MQFDMLIDRTKLYGFFFGLKIPSVDTYASLWMQDCRHCGHLLSFFSHSLTIFCLPYGLQFFRFSLIFSVIIPLYPPGLIQYWCSPASRLPLAFAIFFIQTVSTFIIHEIKIMSSSNSYRLCFTSIMDFFFFFYRAQVTDVFF